MARMIKASAKVHVLASQPRVTSAPDAMIVRAEWRCSCGKTGYRTVPKQAGKNPGPLRVKAMGLAIRAHENHANRARKAAAKRS